MSTKKFSEAMSEVNPKYVEESIVYQRKKRNNRLLWGAAALSACIIVSVCVKLYQPKNVLSPVTVAEPSAEVRTQQNSVDKNEYSSAVSQTPFSLFTPSERDNSIDSFGIDELSHIDIILNTNRLYVQIKESDYEKYGVKHTFEPSDFGEKIGVITEIHSFNGENEVLCSQEPNLAGCEVYRYNPVNCEGVVIVKGNGHCSLFVFQNFTEYSRFLSLKKIYSIFGADSYQTIRSISYQVYQSDTVTVDKVFQGEVNDEEKLKTFYEITQSLTAYDEPDEPYAATPDWLNEARSHYNNAIYVEIEVKFKNGLFTKFDYEPNLGTGYISNHHFLTPEQNLQMKSVFETE